MKNIITFAAMLIVVLFGCKNENEHTMHTVRVNNYGPYVRANLLSLDTINMTALVVTWSGLRRGAVDTALLSWKGADILIEKDTAIFKVTQNSTATYRGSRTHYLYLRVEPLFGCEGCKTLSDPAKSKPPYPVRM